jgi:hypothetical protein
VENPRVVGGVLLWFLAVVSVAVGGFCIYYWDYRLLLLWLACLGIAALSCVVVSVINITVFVPAFWLLGRLTSRGVVKLNTAQTQDPPSADHASRDD